MPKTKLQKLEWGMGLFLCTQKNTKTTWPRIQPPETIFFGFLGHFWFGNGLSRFSWTIIYMKIKSIFLPRYGLQILSFSRNGTSDVIHRGKIASRAKWRFSGRLKMPKFKCPYLRQKWIFFDAVFFVGKLWLSSSWLSLKIRRFSGSAVPL